MADPQAPNRLGELDALRGIAAMVVVLFHYTAQAPHVLPGVRTIDWHVSWGHYGVQLFFAISGFVIFMTLDRTHSAVDFAISRFSRLYPAYWAGIAVTSLGVALLGATSLLQSLPIIGANLTMLQGFLYLPAVDGAYWSLTVELSFYVCMLMLWRLGWLVRIETVLIGWIALKLVWHLCPALPSRLSLLLALSYIQWFAVGIVSYRVRTGTRRWPQQLPVLVAAFAATALVGKPVELFVFVLVVAIFALLAANKLTWLHQRGLLWLGAVSYPLYLVHQNLGYAIMARLEALGVAPWMATIAALAFAGMLAQAIHAWIEQPSLERIRHAWKVRKPLAPVPSVSA